MVTKHSMATVTLTRTQGVQQEPIPLDVQFIHDVSPATLAGRSILTLTSGHRIEVLGTVEAINQQIDAAKGGGKMDDDYVLENAF